MKNCLLCSRSPLFMEYFSRCLSVTSVLLTTQSFPTPPPKSRAQLIGHMVVLNKCLGNWVETIYLCHVVPTILFNDSMRSLILDSGSGTGRRTGSYEGRECREISTKISGVSGFHFLVSGSFYFFPLLSDDHPLKSACPVLSHPLSSIFGI